MIQMLMDGEKRLRVVTGDPTKGDPQKMETDQDSQSVPEPHEFARGFDGRKQLDLPPVPEDDDLNATVIEVMTDIEVLLDGSSVIDVFAVNSARRKRVEVSERKMTESDRSLFKKGKRVGASIMTGSPGIRFGQEKNC